MAPTHFTLAEANAALAEVRPLTEQLVSHRQELRTARARRGELVMRVAGNGSAVDPQQLADLDEQIAAELVGVARCVNGIHALGALVKDPDSGLVDFPARVEGEEAFLCWRLGEDEISYWHGLEEGFAGRKPV
jgi:hypothetical protein